MHLYYILDDLYDDVFQELADSAEHAQELYIDHCEHFQIPHGNLKIIREY